MKKNKELVILFIIVLLFSLYKIINVSIGYDTDIIIVNPKYIMLSWIGLMRYGLVLLKSGLYLYGNVSIRLLNILTYVNVFIYSVLFLKFLKLDSSDKNIFKNILSIILVITSPILLEQYYFTLQSVEVSLGMILMMISFILTYNYLKNNKLWYVLLIIPLLIICFSIYQSFVNLYILGALISLYKVNKDNNKNIIKCIVIFMISFILYYVIGNAVINIMDISETAYLTSRIGWLYNIKDTVLGIGKDFIKVFIGYGHVLNLGYLICIIIVICNIVRSKKDYKTLYLILMLLVPFALNILTGSRLVIRSLFTIPFLYGFIFYEFYDKKYIKYILIILILSQIINSYILMISDYHRYIDDVKMSEKIYLDCGSEDNYIYLYGILDTDNIKGEAMGYSYYEWYELGHLSYDRIHNFSVIHNYNYNMDDNYIDIEFNGVYPDSGYIIKDNNKCYVNIGK